MFDLLGVILLGYILLLGIILNRLLEKTWITPPFLLVAWVGIFIFGDAIYMLFSKDYGPGEFERFSLNSNEVGIVSVIWSSALISFYIFYFLSRSNAKKLFNKKLLRFKYQITNLGGARFILVISFIISLCALIYLILNAFSLGYSLSQVTNLRNKWFSDGGGILLTFIQSFKYALLLYIYIYFLNKKESKKILILLVLITLSIDLFLGTRSSFIYGFLLPLLIVTNNIYKKIRLNQLLVISVIIVITIGLVYRTISRDQFFQSNLHQSISEILIKNMQSFPKFFWGGFEASSLDGAIDIIRKYPQEAEFLNGLTLVSGLVSPVPRIIWENKPRGGANYIYTNTFYPTFYGQIRSEYSVSFLGELYMNFGIIGVWLGFGIFGLFMGFLYNFLIIKGRESIFILIYSVVVSRTYSLLRGDLYNFISQLFISILNLLVILSIYLILCNFFLKGKFFDSKSSLESSINRESIIKGRIAKID